MASKARSVFIIHDWYFSAGIFSSFGITSSRITMGFFMCYPQDTLQRKHEEMGIALYI